MPGFLYPSCDLFVQCVIAGDGAAKVLESVDVLDLCASNGDAWRLGETFWCGLKENVSDASQNLSTIACRGLSWWAIDVQSSANRVLTMSLFISFLLAVEAANLTMNRPGGI